MSNVSRLDSAPLKSALSSAREHFNVLYEMARAEIAGEVAVAIGAGIGLGLDAQARAWAIWTYVFPHTIDRVYLDNNSFSVLFDSYMTTCAACGVAPLDYDEFLNQLYDLADTNS